MQFSEQLIVSATKEDIFEVYRNVHLWNQWDSEVKESSLTGNFESGSVGVLLPNKGPKVKFTLTEVTQNRSFTSQCKFPLSLMEFTHTLEQSGSSTLVTHSVRIAGVTSFIFNKVIGEPIKKGLPEQLKGLKAACE